MSKISIGKLFLIIIISFFSNLSYSKYSKGVDKLLNLHRTKPDVALKKMQKFVEKKVVPMTGIFMLICTIIDIELQKTA